MHATHAIGELKNLNFNSIPSGGPVTLAIACYTVLMNDSFCVFFSKLKELVQKSELIKLRGPKGFNLLTNRMLFTYFGVKDFI